MYMHIGIPVDEHHEVISQEEAVNSGERGIQKVGKEGEVAKIARCVLPCDFADHRIRTQVLQQQQEQYLRLCVPAQTHTQNTLDFHLRTHT